jgi:hypothetical protein
MARPAVFRGLLFVHSQLEPRHKAIYTQKVSAANELLRLKYKCWFEFRLRHFSGDSFSNAASGEKKVLSEMIGKGLSREVVGILQTDVTAPARSHAVTAVSAATNALASGPVLDQTSSRPNRSGPRRYGTKALFAGVPQSTPLTLVDPQHYFDLSL